MGQWTNWWLGCKPNPPKNNPTMVPWGDESWRNHPSKPFTLLLFPSGHEGHPASVLVDTEQHPMPPDQLESSLEHS